MTWIQTNRPLNVPLSVALYLLVLVMLVCLIVPLTPDMPQAGLDPSWMMTINQAVAQGLVFGRDLVFTFGPYAAVYTHVFHPDTDALALVASVHVVLGFWLALFALTRRALWPAMLALLFGVLILSWSRDAMYLAYPVMVALVCHQLTQDMSDGETSYWPLLLFMAMLFSVMGLLPLIKGSMLVACVAAASVCVWMLLLRSDWRLLLILLISPTFTAIAYWHAAGQPLGFLKDYLFNMGPIVSGYTDAMSRFGFLHEVVLFALASAALLWHVWRAKQGGGSLVFVLVPALFLAFKAGYVRHDSHAIASAVFLLFICVLLVFVQSKSGSRQRGLALASVLAVVLMLSAVSVYSIQPESLRALVAQRAQAQGMVAPQFNGLPRGEQVRLMAKTLQVADVWQLVSRSWAVPFSFTPLWEGFRLRVWDAGALTAAYRQRLEDIRERAALPAVQGRTDMYFADQTVLIASGNAWHPRPVFQSYSAYTPQLLKMNEAHLLSEQAPAHLFVRMDTLDQRWPAAEDGVSWQTWLWAYEPKGTVSQTLHLQRRFNPSPRPLLQPLAVVQAHMGRAIAVPDTGTQVWVSMHIQPSWWGRLASLFYQSSPLEIQLTLRDGSTAAYRLIPGQVQTDVLLSPLVTEVGQLADLFDKGRTAVGQQVVSVMVSPVGAAVLWRPQYQVAFKHMLQPEQR